MSQMDLDCRKCNQHQREDHGYEKDSPIPKRWSVGEYSFQRCPLRVVTKQSKEYIEAYKLFKMGYLPRGGGWIHESQKFLDAMNVIETEVHKLEHSNG